MIQLPRTAILVLFGALCYSTASALLKVDAKCKTTPGDPSWPTTFQWNAFNKTVNGRLIRTVPVGTPCHTAHFDADACTSVQNGWHLPDFHELSSSSVMTPFFSNNSCNPFTDPDSRCIIGTYVQYAVNVSTPAHVLETLKFAKEHNIRFVVRNTGHDYMGKSTGAGALSVWMHHLKGAEWIPEYTSSGYNGPAVKVAAGVQVRELYEDADAHNHTVVGGACPTVGFAGGYIQGGGHSPLSTVHGLAADQTLSFEVVTTTGSFVIASSTENPDLYWALSGGGGGTYGIVWSVTVEAHPPLPVAFATLSFKTDPNVSLDTWWDAVNVYQASIPNYTAAGGYSVVSLARGSFSMGPLLIPARNGTVSPTDVAQGLLQPLLDRLNASAIPYNHTITGYPSFLSAYLSLPTAAFDVGVQQFGSGRLLPMGLWKDVASFNAMTAVVREIVDDGGVMTDVSFTALPLPVAGLETTNAVLPAWRQSQRMMIPILPWSDTSSPETINAQRHTLTWKYGEALRKLTPRSGAYLNEADTSEPDWKNSFYGVNYPKLLETKDKWDPDQMLYGSTAVGGDRWVENGRGALCRV